ncbi:patatin family protein [Abyssogena phaseoliformis symbiont OG214]|nr:Patatin-like protein [Candidatus Ruthia sp. Apha_13_S6]BBB22725.1 patatin family protein [Abyssogena phaseoliformis symbiont OG214]
MFLKTTDKKPNIHTRILSIDGGGVRGIVPAVILSYLEEKIQQLSSNAGARLADYFDLFAGTSTGGLIIAGLLTPDESGRPKYTANDIVQLYLEHSKTIFQSSFIQEVKSASGLLDVKYDVKGINLVYQQYFANQTLKELLKPCLIPVYDLIQGENYFFRQHKAVVNEKHNYYLKDAMRAATSAITYFPPANITTVDGLNQHCFIDGGIFAVNPALSAYAEFRRLNPNLYFVNTMLLSLGTGRQDTHLDCDAIKHWGAVEWRDVGSNLVTTSLSEVCDYQLNTVYGKDSNYFRINPFIKPSHSANIDNSDGEYLDFLYQLGRQAIVFNQKSLNHFASQLVENHAT